tara:strand:+ start:360 stop:494 length:135 start_codon:yes stop_codon:yes gene_type:complete
MDTFNYLFILNEQDRWDLFDQRKDEFTEGKKIKDEFGGFKTLKK